jgi:hypothetical protein
MVLTASLKSQTQKLSIIKEAKGRLDKLLDEFNNIAIEDDVNEERNNLSIRAATKVESPINA